MVSRWLKDISDLEQLLGEQPRLAIKEIWHVLTRRKRLDISAIAAVAREHFGLNDREPVHDICGLLESSHSHPR